MRRLAFLLACAALSTAPAWAQPAAAPAPPAGDAARTIEAIARIGSSTSPSFSPDGARIAFISNRSGSPQVWTVSSSGGVPVQVTRLADPVQSVHWSPRGDRLAFDVAPGGGLNVQIYTAAPDGSGLKRLTAGGQENNQLSGWSDDGAQLRAASNARDPAVFDALLMDPVTGVTRRVGKGAGRNAITDISDDGRFAVVTRLVSRGDNNLHLVNLRSGAETLLTPHSGTGQTGWGEFSPDGRRLYVSTNNGRDLIGFGVIALDAAGRPGPIRMLATRDDAEGDNAVLDETGRRAAITWNVGGRSQLALLDTATGRLSRGPALPADIVGGPTFTRDGSKLAMTISGSAAPVDIHVLDLRTQRLTQVTRSQHDGVDLAALVRPTLVTYRGHDGLQQSGWLYRPRGAEGPGPVVFNFHGGPEGQSRPTMSDVAQALAVKGVSVFAPNVRGSSGFGKRFVNLDNGAKRVDGVRDMKAAVDHLVKIGVADPKRAGVMGGSYGGYMVMAGVTEYPDLFAAGANLFGIVNFDTFFKNSQPWMAAISTVEYGDPVREAAMLASLSPIHKLERIKTPLIVLHGANDTNVPVIEAEQIVAGLKARNVPVEYVLFADEGHGWRKTANRVRSTTALVDFFDRHLNRR